MKQFNLDPLYPFLNTQRDIADLTNKLMSLHMLLAQHEATPEKLLFEHLPYELAHAIQQIAQEAGVSLTEETGLEMFFQLLEERVSDIPVLTIHLARNPHKKLIDQIKEWWSKNSNTHIILQVKTNPSLLGGMQLYFNGKYKDYSLRKQLGTNLEVPI